MKRLWLLVTILELSITLSSAEPQTGSLGLRLIVVKTEAEAKELLTRLQSGEQFDELAQKYPVDSSAAAGGYVGRVTVGDLRQEFQDGLRGLRPGQASPVTGVGGEYALLQLLTDEETWRIELVVAATFGDGAEVKSLLGRGADASREALFVAAARGHADVIEALLAAGADLNERNDVGASVLMVAAAQGRVGVIKVLLDAGADIEADNQGATALMEAAFQGRADSVRLLLEKGASLDAKASNGWTALMGGLLGGHTDVVRELVDAGADVNIRANGQFPLMIPFLKRGKEFAVPVQRDRLELVRILLHAGADVNAVDPSAAMTELMAAAKEGDVEMINLLVDSGADIVARDDAGRTALIHAEESGRSAAVQALLAALKAAAK